MRHLMAATAMLLLAACGGQADDAPANGAAGETASKADAAAAAATGGGSISLQPGEWEMTMQIGRMSMANMPPGVEMPLPPPTTIRTCLTAEQAGQPNADFITGNAGRAGCRSENMRMANGRIQGVVQCEMEGVTTRSTLDGRFTPTRYELDQRVETESQGQPMQTEMRITARRLGDCPAG